MRTGRASFGMLWGSVLLSFGVAVPAFAGQVKSVELNQSAAGTRAEILLDSAADADGFRILSLHAPERLVVDLPGTTAAGALKLPGRGGIVQSVRTGKPNADTLRIVFDLSVPTAPKPTLKTVDGGSRLLIQWPGNPVGDKPVVDASGNAAIAGAASVAGLAAQPVENSSPEKESMQVALSPLDILNGSQVALQAPEVSMPETRKEREAREKAEKQAEKQQAVADAKAADDERRATSRALRAGIRPLIVAIDAGHGGKDTGAIGPTGKYEKDATLAIARELARQIDATPGMKSYLVRDGDYFIPLDDRARKARTAHADLFVSIHADSAGDNHSASGSSVYVLSLKGATSQRARWLADKENSSDLIGGRPLQQDTLSNVLLDLAQSGHMKASEDCANRVLDRLERIGNSHTGQIEKANFAVLRTSDMPSMLVETAYISNYTEERQLATPEYQRKLASAVLGGVQDYFNRQPPPGTLFAARAQIDAVHYGDVAGGGAP